MPRKISVAVLLPTYNSEKYLKEQLDSILKQVGVNVKIYISDDGSTDNTLKILKKYFKKYPKNFKYLYKVNFNEPCSNFYSLLLKVPKYKYYALADHDDIWMKDKILRAINFLKKGYDLYGSRVKAVDKNLKFIGFSPLFKKQPKFENALVQGLFANNTTVLSHEIIKLVRIKKINFITDISWLLYLLATFYGKKVFYDKVSKLLYRQHENNVHGISLSMNSKLLRIYRFLKANEKRVNNNHIGYLKSIIKNQPEKNIYILKSFDYMRKNMNFFNFDNNFFNKLGIYRQTKLGNILLKAGIILNRE